MCFGICFAFNLQWMDRVVNSDDVKDINLNDPQFKFTLMERRMKEIKGLLSKSGRSPLFLKHCRIGHLKN